MRGCIGPSSHGRSATAPDVVMGIDNVGHAAFSFARSRTLAQMESIEQPSARRSRNGRAATKAGGPRLEGRHRRRAASARRCASASARDARPRRAMAVGSPRSSPSDSTTDAAPRDSAAKRGTARKAPSASPMRVPPSQSATSSEAAASACSRLRQAQRPGDAGEPRPDGEDLDRVGGAHQRVGESEMRLGALLHRAGDVDENNDRGAAAAGAARCRRRMNSPALRMASRNMRRASVPAPPRAERQR